MKKLQLFTLLTLTHFSLSFKIDDTNFQANLVSQAMAQEEVSPDVLAAEELAQAAAEMEAAKAPEALTGTGQEAVPSPTWKQNVKKLFKKNPHRPKPVRYSEIKTWKPMGHRYAGGHDSEGKLLMVVDLAYPNVFYPKDLPRSLLGALGVGHINAQTAVGAIKNLAVHISEDKKKKALGNFINQENPVLKCGQKDGAESDGNQEGAKLPDKFTLADFDLEKLSGKSLTKFHQLMKSIGIKGNFLERVQFEKNPDGGYDVFFLGTGKAGRPPKVIDFRAYKSSYAMAGKMASGMMILKAAVGSIPFPPFKNIVAAYLERWLMLYEVQYLGHTAQVLQLLEDAYHGDPDSPFSQLSKDELEKGLRYVHNANTMMSNMIPKIFLGRKNPWERKEKLYDKKRERSLEWIKSKELEVAPFHRNFAFVGDKKGHRKIVVLSHSALFRKQPITAVNYDHPQYEIAKRTVKEVIQQGMNYLDIGITYPLVPSVIQIVHGAFVTDEVYRRKNWEARLASWMLNQQHLHKDKGWEDEIEMLYARRLNPFELSREDEEKLIRLRQKHLKAE